MSTTFVDVLLQLRNELGTDVLSGGKIYTYEAGTTTPLATYTDLAGASANTNPVILDSAGMAEIRQTDGVAYKWVIYDSDDNELWSRDNIVVGTSSSASSDDLIFNFSFVGTPGAQQFLGGYKLDRACTLPIDLEGAGGEVITTAPSGDYEISIAKNGTEVATATIDVSGDYTFATTGGTTVSLASGDYITATAPDSGTVKDFFFSFAGEV